MITSSHPNRRANPQPRGIAAVVWVGIAYFVAALVVLHVLRPDHDPVAQTTSHYAVGPYGWIMSSVFVSMSVATFALVAGLHRMKVSYVGLTLLAAWGVASLVAMLFPINPDGTPLTTSGLVHRVNGPIGFLGLSVGAMVVSWRLRKELNRSTLDGTLRVLSLAMFVGFAVTTVNIAGQTGFAGLSQRILLVFVVAWYGVATARLRAMGQITVDRQLG